MRKVIAIGKAIDSCSWRQSRMWYATMHKANSPNVKIIWNILANKLLLFGDINSIKTTKPTVYIPATHIAVKDDVKVNIKSEFEYEQMMHEVKAIEGAKKNIVRRPYLLWDWNYINIQ